MLRKQRWFYGLILLLLSSVVFADGTDPSITSSAVTTHSDISINFLGQLFGTVGNSLSGTSGQLLGKLFYELNVGILVVAGIWLAYTIVTLVFGAATEGGFMSGRNNTILAFLKVAIGIAALVPSPTTGYSAVQDIFMKVVVKSVELADMTWTHGLNYLKAGGAVWTPPATTTGSLTGASFTTIFNKVIVPTFNAEVCMYEKSIQAQANSNSNGGSYVSNALNPSDNKKHFVFNFPSSKDDSGAAGCGTFNWGSIPGAHTTITDTDGTNSAANQNDIEPGDFAYEAAYKVVYGLLPAAKNYACAVSQSVKGSICEGLNKTVDKDTDSEVMFNNILAYANAITPLARYQTRTVAGSATQFFDTVSDQGWILAGRYYWDLSQFSDKLSAAVNLSTYVPTATGDETVNPTLRDIEIHYLNAKYAQYTGSSAAGNSNAAGFNSGSGGKYIGPLVNSFYGDIHNLVNQFSSPGSDPIGFLHRVGTLCLNIAGDIWIQFAILAAGLTIAGMFCRGKVDGDAPIKTAIDWFKPIALALAGIFIASGAIFTFYVPVYAFFVFTFGVIAWFILVIESMVAAPLVAFGMTHPQGHDFLGKVEQSLMLLLGVFLRPVLMVIGLFAAMILAFIAFRMTNYGFATFMSDIFTSTPVAYSATSAPSPLQGMQSFMSHAGGQSSMGQVSFVLIAMPVMLFMYAMAVFSIVNQCYSVIYKLPDYVMRWIGSPVQDSGIPQLMGSIQESVGSNAKSVGGAGGEGIMKAGSDMGQFAGKQMAGKKSGKAGGSGSIDANPTSGS